MNAYTNIINNTDNDDVTFITPNGITGTVHDTLIANPDVIYASLISPEPRIVVTLQRLGDTFVMQSPLTGKHTLSAHTVITNTERLRVHWEGFCEINDSKVRQERLYGRMQPVQPNATRTMLSDAERLQALRFVANAQFVMLRAIAKGESWSSGDYYDALNFFRDIERACA